MRDLNEIECFLSVVEHKSISMAAKKMMIPKSTISRKIIKLEQRLRVTLLIRTTRSISLTEEGKLYYKSLATIFQEIDHAEDLISNTKKSVQGTLRITTPLIFGSGDFVKKLANFAKMYPELDIDFVATDNLINLVTDGFDLGIRVGKLQDSSLKAKRIQSLETKIVATPKFIKDSGGLKTINALDSKNCLAFAPKGSPFPWELKNKSKKKIINPRSQLKVSHLYSLKDAVLNNLGYALLPTEIVKEKIEDGQLVTVFPEWSSNSVPIQIVYPSQKYVAPKVRAFIDFFSL
jgi:DNA-binding transcriptional LysR family regulator